MSLPDSLRANSVLELRLSDSWSISMSRTLVQFDPWLGPGVADDYNRKPVLNFAGEPLFAELVILRHFQAAGWQGVWLDTYQRRTRLSLTEDMPLPSAPRDLLGRIAKRAGTTHGCFDVFAWSGGHVAFAEAKRGGRDRIRASQVRWLAAALEVGVPREAFLVVEWSLAGNQRG